MVRNAIVRKRTITNRVLGRGAHGATPRQSRRQKMARYELDPTHTHIGFTAKHMMVSTVRGNFTDWSAYVDGDVSEPTSALAEATIKTASVDTGATDRDNHLRSTDFFSVDEYPDMTYRSTSIAKTDDNNYKVTGALSITT